VITINEQTATAQAVKEIAEKLGDSIFEISQGLAAIEVVTTIEVVPDKDNGQIVFQVKGKDKNGDKLQTAFVRLSENQANMFLRQLVIALNHLAD
jgi:hypothetical protein